MVEGKIEHKTFLILVFDKFDDFSKLVVHSTFTIPNFGAKVLTGTLGTGYRGYQMKGPESR